MKNKTKALFNVLADIHPEVRYLQGVGDAQKITLSPYIRQEILMACNDAGLVFKTYQGIEPSDLWFIEEIDVGQADLPS